MHRALFIKLVESASLKSLLFIVLATAVFGGWAALPGHAETEHRSYAAFGPFRYVMVHALSGVNLQDAKVAVTLNWSRHLENTFPGMISEFDILTDAQAAGRLVAEGKLHGLSLGIAQYLELQKQVELKPVFISSRLSSPLESFLLLVRKGGDWKSLSDLPVRRLVMEKTAAPNIGQMWLETLLHHQNLPTAANYFSEIATAAKQARIVLPLFFGQADACLVPESAYQTMTELNPQIDRKLHILARSPGLVKTIHCATGLMPGHMVERFIEKGVNMQDTPDGRQLLMIFHVKKNFVFQPQYITDSQRIFRQYQELLSVKSNS